MALYVRSLSTDQKRRLERLQAATNQDDDLRKRARIVLMSAKRRRVHEISSAVDLHPINVRKWIHRFNTYGIDGLLPRRSPGRPRIFDEAQREAIIELATTDPRTLGLGFSVWSLQRLRLILIDRGIMEEISAETIRQELLRGGLTFEGRRWVRQES